jgi:hypothetical protein
MTPDLPTRADLDAMDPAAVIDPNVCPKSRRVDGPYHSTRWDGDDPYTVCVFCGQMRDAISGQVIEEVEG